MPMSTVPVMTTSLLQTTDMTMTGSSSIVNTTMSTSHGPVTSTVVTMMPTSYISPVGISTSVVNSTSVSVSPTLSSSIISSSVTTTSAPPRIAYVTGHVRITNGAVWSSELADKTTGQYIALKNRLYNAV
jgi:hypothetical protein